MNLREIRTQNFNWLTGSKFLPLNCRKMPRSRWIASGNFIRQTFNMETKTASTRTLGLLSLFDYHTGFFARVLEGISEENMHNRLNTQANHPAWLAGALVNQRFLMASET